MLFMKMPQISYTYSMWIINLKVFFAKVQNEGKINFFRKFHLKWTFELFGYIYICIKYMYIYVIYKHL